jgi:hypothetical protein
MEPNVQDDEEEVAPVDNDMEGVRHCLFVCGLETPAQQDAILLEGFVDIRSFAKLRSKDILEMVKTINTPPPPARGRPAAEAPAPVKITRRSARRLDGLVFWVKDKIRRGVDIDPFAFTEASLLDALQEVEGIETADTVDADLPEKFTTERWIQWEIEMMNYLSTKKGIRGVPLSYVVRPDLPDDDIISPDDVTRQEMYAAPLDGAAFRRDNNTVWGIIRSCTIGTPAWDWIKQLDRTGDGRLGMKKLRDHYDGPDKKKARINAAETTIENLHYKGEKRCRSRNLSPN